MRAVAVLCLVCGVAGAGVRATWRVPLTGDASELVYEVVDGLVVVRVQGGRSLAIDVETGKKRALVVDAPRGVAHGLLVGGEGNSIAAIELASGAVKWSRQVIAAAEHDEYALRDTLAVVDSQSLVVLAYSTRREQLVIGVDPPSGGERWRVTLQDRPTRVVGDGERAFVRTLKQLIALDAATGKRLWEVALAAPPELAVGDGIVALGLADRLQVLDARSGAQLADVRVAGQPTELVVRDGGVLAALETAPGSASVAAVDAKAGRVAWSRPVAYSVQRLRADAQSAYVLDGNGRVTALARSDGRERFALSTGSFDVAVARTKAGAARVLVVDNGALAAFDPPAGARASSLAAFVRWELDASCRPRALALVDGDDRIVWQRDLPARMRGLTFGSCTDHETVMYRRRPRPTGGLLYGVLGIEQAAGAYVVADLSGLFVLRAKDGTILLDAPAATTTTQRVFFDDGTYDYAGTCRGPAQHAQLFVRCGDVGVYFNGQTAMVLSLRTLRVEAQATFPADATVRAQGLRTDVTLQVGKRALRLQGRTYEE